jgi:hypothetical protein
MKCASLIINTISDVIIHMKYSAREGGSTLRDLAETTLRISSMK